jgi:hypothetical protein
VVIRRKKISDWSSIVEGGSIFDIAVERRNSHSDNSWAKVNWIFSFSIGSTFVDRIVFYNTKILSPF